MVWSIFMPVLKLLDPPNVVDKSGEQFVLRTWQHYKAYLSAHSSWYKAARKLLLLLVVRGLEVGLTAREKRDFTRILGCPPEASDPEEGEKAPEHADAAEAVLGSPRERQQQQQQQQGAQAQQQEGWQVQEQEQQQHGGEAQQQQGWQAQQHDGWQVQQQEQEQQQALGDQQLLPSGSGGMSIADTIELQLVLGKTRILVGLVRALISKLAGLEACEGGNEPVTRSSSSSSKGGDTSSQGAFGLNSVRLSSSNTSSSDEGIVVPPSAACHMILVQVTTATLLLRECVASWQRSACGQPTVGVEHANPPSSSSAPAAAAAAATTSSAAANMARVSVLGDLSANGQAAVRDGSLDAMAAASTGGAAAAVVGGAEPVASATAEVVPPERFSWFAARGLPKAVIEQLDRSSSVYGQPVWWEGDPPAPEDMHSIVHGLAEVTPLEGQLGMLHELVMLGEVLLAEVPCPLGCSNPGCVNLGGESEVREAGKVCAACKVVYYCSRRCQVEHWKAGHGMVCGRLGQQDKQVLQ